MKPSLKYFFSLFLLFSVILINNKCIAQNEIWSDPISVTDSISFNKNPEIISIGNKIYMFWEKSNDDTSTSIYMRNISDMTEPVAVLKETGVHYKNPKFIKFDYYNNNPDTLFYMFYESDIEGDFNIHYIKYSQDGNFSNSSPISVSYTGAQNIAIEGRNIVWEEGGNIKCVSLDGNNDNYYFTEYPNIDELACKNPAIGGNEILYEKEVDGKSHIYRSTFDLVSNTWSAPEPFYTIGDNTSISIIKDASYESEINSFLWESKQDEVWKIFGFDYWEATIEELDLQSESRLYPYGLYFNFILKNNYTYFPYINYLACVFNENENDEIFVNPQWDFPNCFNISNSSAKDTHPKLFYNYISFKHYSHILWESDRNGFQQIFMCETWFTVNTEEKIKNNFSLKTTPNPCNDHLNIEFSVKKPSLVSLSIYNNLGQCISQLLQSEQITQSNQMTWDLKNTQGIKVSSGTYFVHLLIDNKTSIQKVIIQ